MIFRAFFLFLLAPPAFAGSLAEAIAPASQLVVVTGATDAGFTAEIRAYERAKDGWHPRGKTAKAVLGKAGLATGTGIYAGPEFDVGFAKKEGDRRTPTGVFEFGKVYGVAAPKDFKGPMPYRAITASLEGIDDPKSRFYNQIVDRTEIPEPDWISHETILRKDRLYRWLVEVRNNPANAPGAGSLIFLHVWRGPTDGTAGCVAAEESKVRDLLEWLDPAKSPRIVVVPARGRAAIDAILDRKGDR